MKFEDLEIEEMSFISEVDECVVCRRTFYEEQTAIVLKYKKFSRIIENHICYSCACDLRDFFEINEI